MGEELKNSTEIYVYAQFEFSSQQVILDLKYCMMNKSVATSPPSLCFVDLLFMHMYCLVMRRFIAL